jgi:shikimate dehydrogenase
VTRVDGTTQVYAVLGQPVHHSKSPEIQNAAFRAAGMNAVYVALEVPGPRLRQALDGLHAARVLGLNLTTPHKESAFAVARERTRDAEEARAVNTLRWESGGWSGHATDGVGFLAWLAEIGVDARGRRVLVLGAGGAARAVLPKLLGLVPESVHVVSRSAEHARSVATEAAKSGAKTRITSAGVGDPESGASGKGASGAGWDLMIRAVSTESVSEEEGCWWRMHAPSALVLDLNYGARSAEARARAKAEALRYEDGDALLLHQGAASFEFWTGKKADRDAMREALRAAE